MSIDNTELELTIASLKKRERDLFQNLQDTRAALRELTYLRSCPGGRSLSSQTDAGCRRRHQLA